MNLKVLLTIRNDWLNWGQMVRSGKEWGLWHLPELLIEQLMTNIALRFPKQCVMNS